MDYDLVYLLVGLGIGFAIGFKVADHIHQTLIADIFRRAGVTPDDLQRVMNDLKTEIGEDIEDLDPSEFPKVEVKIEQHGGQIYAFRKDNDQFLGQGTDRESLLKIVAEKFTNVTLVIREEDGAALVKENPTA